MRELHGVVNVGLDNTSILKRQSLLIDKFHTIGMPTEDNKPSDEWMADLEFLEDQGVVSQFTPDDLRKIDSKLTPQAINVGNREVSVLLSEGDIVLSTRILQSVPNEDYEAYLVSERLINDYIVRRLASGYSSSSGLETVPVCKEELRPTISQKRDTFTVQETVLSVAIQALPTPTSDSSWEDIIEFKTAAHDKLWSLRRFLHSLSTKSLTVSEIRDDIEWSLNEYAKEMKLHRIKAGNSFVEVYVIPTIEVIENIAKFNWSTIAKGALSVKKRKVELMEAEMKAPGREVAYIYDAQNRFGSDDA